MYHKLTNVEVPVKTMIALCKNTNASILHKRNCEHILPIVWEDNEVLWDIPTEKDY